MRIDFWTEAVKDNYTPEVSDTGAHMAELMEDKLSNMLNKFETRINNAVEALNTPKPDETSNSTGNQPEAENGDSEQPEQPNNGEEDFEGVS